MKRWKELYSFYWIWKIHQQIERFSSIPSQFNKQQHYMHLRHKHRCQSIRLQCNSFFFHSFPFGAHNFRRAEKAMFGNDAEQPGTEPRIRLAVWWLGFALALVPIGHVSSSDCGLHVYQRRPLPTSPSTTVSLICSVINPVTRSLGKMVL